MKHLFTVRTIGVLLHIWNLSLVVFGYNNDGEGNEKEPIESSVHNERSLVNKLIVINEVASTATPYYGYCEGNDWIELFLDGNGVFDLVGYVLHDNRGPTNNESFTFPSGFNVLGDLYVICGNNTKTNQNPVSFQFDIDSNDTITLRDSGGNIVSTTDIVSYGGNASSTYQRSGTSNNTFIYRSPTPGRYNNITIPPGDQCFMAIVIDDPLSGEFIYSDTTNSLGDYEYYYTFSYGLGVWYKFRNPYVAPLTFSATTCYNGTNFDAKIRVFEGEYCYLLRDTGTKVNACRSDAKVNFVAAGLTTYHILVHSVDFTVGRFTLTITNDTSVPVSTPAPMIIPVGGHSTNAPAPVPVPIKIPVPIPVPIPIPLPTPIFIPTGPVPIPVTASIPVPDSFVAPTPTIVVVAPNPIPTPINVPTTIQVPISKVPTKSPTKSPTRSLETCGLFGLNFFCIFGRNKCGFWRRLLNLRGC